MSNHSHILGGSNAQRLLSCPASYLESARAPVADIESEYAKEGTWLHTIITYCIQHRVTAEQLRSDREWEDLKGVTDEQRETLAKGLNELERLKTQYAGAKPWRVLALEKMLPLPMVTGAFGSVDLVLINDEAVIVLDWKFGRGVPVFAVYPQADGSEQLNAQTAFYACCAKAAFARQFKGKTIVLAIVQPRLEPALSYAETDMIELDGFWTAFHEAVKEAMGRHAYRERGEWCRFAVCKSTCPLWTGPVFDLAVLDPAKAALRAAANGEMTEFGAFLSRAMDLAELAETWAIEIRRQAHVYLEEGGKVRGWKLVPKRGTRQWVNAEEAPAALRALGAVSDDILTAPELKSVAQVEKSLQKKKIQLPAELHHTVSSGTTIVHSDDARPESSHAQVMQNLRIALKAL